MEVVIDTSVVMAVVLNEPVKDSLVAHTIDTTLVAPASVHWEVGNALSAMLKRKRISPAQARMALAAYQMIPIRFVDVSLKQAVDMAAELDIYAYDAYVLATARHQTCGLLTLDAGLMHAARKVGVAVVEVGT